MTMCDMSRLRTCLVDFSKTMRDEHFITNKRYQDSLAKLKE